MKELIKVLSSINGIVAVGLGGSRGLGIADENSDYDFVLFRNGGESIPAQPVLDVLKPFIDPGSLITHANFITAQVSGKKIEIFQKDLNYVAKEIAIAKEGKFRWTIRSLLPHGYLSTGLITHIMYLQLCSEKNESVSRLRRQVDPFPVLLMRSLVNSFLRQATIIAIHASKIRRPEDLQYLMGLCSEFVFSANIIIFALNKKFPVLERGGSRLIRGFPIRPRNYEERVTELFQASCRGDFRLVSSELNAIHEELRAFAKDVLGDQKPL